MVGRFGRIAMPVGLECLRARGGPAGTHGQTVGWAAFGCLGRKHPFFADGRSMNRSKHPSNAWKVSTCTTAFWMLYFIAVILSCQQTTISAVNLRFRDSMCVPKDSVGWRHPTLSDWEGIHHVLALKFCLSNMDGFFRET